MRALPLAWRIACRIACRLVCLSACLLACIARPAFAADTADAGAAALPAATPAQVLVLLDLPPPHFRPDRNYGGGYADTAGRGAQRAIAAAIAKAHGLRLAKDWPLPAVRLDCYVMDVPATLSADEVARRIEREPGVAWAQVANVFRPLGHDDPLFPMQPVARAWQLDDLHRAALGRGVRVAVIDSGIQADHPDLAGQITTQENFVADRPEAAEQHGTAVAGIIAALADNHLGIVGVAPGAHVLALRACWQAAPADTRCSSLSLALALNAAIGRDADVINLSLGGPPDRLIARLIEAAIAHHIAVVAAADRALADGGFPAALPGVTAAIDDAAPSTVAGAVGAPGIDIPTTTTASRWATVSGSSYAAAHVSGLLALLIEARAASRSMLARTSGGIPDPTGLVLRDGGLIDACASLARAARRCVCGCGLTSAAAQVASH